MKRVCFVLMVLFAVSLIITVSDSSATTYYVPDDFDGIQLALDGVVHNDEIIVRDNTYYENIVWPLKVGIVLRSENGPQNCTIDGSGVNNVVVISTGVGLSTIVQGFTVANGVNGITISSGSTPIIRDFIVQNNLNNGILITGCSPQIEQSSIMANAGHGMKLSSSSARITDCTIADNSMRGLFCERGSPIVTSNTIENNIEGGIYLNGTFAAVSSNIIRNHNIAADGAAFLITSPSGSGIQPVNIISNNLIYNNAAWSGGAFWINGYKSTTYSYPVYYDRSVIINNTIDNNSSDDGTVRLNSFTATTIQNNIITNTTSGYGIYGSGAYLSPTISHNDLWNNFDGDYQSCAGGEGAIAVEPLYIDDLNENYHISLGSATIDAGLNDISQIPDTDFDGQQRILDGDGDLNPIVDMGAYEYNIGCVDSDVDGYGEPASAVCSYPQLDCNNLNPLIYPTNPNTYCNCEDPFPQGTEESEAAGNCADGIDNDCDGLVDNCGGGPCTGSAEASTYESSPVHGSSDLVKHLGYFMLPLGAVIAIRIWRRKR